MPKLKTHIPVFRAMKQKGCFVTTTLCGVFSQARDAVADRNVADDSNPVTCKVCLRIQSQPNHWRHKNILTPADIDAGI